MLPSFWFPQTTPSTSLTITQAVLPGYSSAKLTTKSPSYTYRGQRRQGMLAYRIFASFPPGTTAVSSLPLPMTTW